MRKKNENEKKNEKKKSVLQLVILRHATYFISVKLISYQEDNSRKVVSFSGLFSISFFVCVQLLIQLYPNTIFDLQFTEKILEAI